MIPIEQKDQSQQLRMNFFQTTPMSVSEREERIKKIVGQNLVVFKFFRSNPKRSFTPFEVLQFSGINAPITSIRRAITTLTQDGHLIRTNEMRQGDYGAINHTWRYAG